MPISRNLNEDALIQPIHHFFRQSTVADPLAWLVGRLPSTARVLVAGGAIRNLLIAAIHGAAPRTRDVDLFIDGLPSDSSLATLLRVNRQRVEPTDLKGLRWHPETSHLAFDLCRLSDFIAIAVGHLDPTPANLLASIDFTANAVIYDVGTRVLTECGCTDAVRRRRLDFNGRIIPDKGLMANRILLIAHKTGFILAEPVLRYLRERLDLETLTRVKRMLRAKQGRRQADAIMAGYDRICQFKAHAAYLDAVATPSTGGGPW